MSRSKGWHREDIKAAIRKRGSTLRAVSLQAGLCRDAATVALREPFPSAQRAIAKFLDLPLHIIWPQWYDTNDQRIASQSSRKASPKCTVCQCKKSRVKSASSRKTEILPHHPDNSARQARGEGVAAMAAATPTNSTFTTHQP